MCGIVACRTDGSAPDFLVPALTRLEYRGYDSVGVSILTEVGTTARVRSISRVQGLARKLDDWRGYGLSGVGIGHTRWATHGAVTELNAHPHRDCRGRVSVVHNGIIENADRIRTELEGSGHLFASDVDSEVISHLIEDALQRTGDFKAAVRDAVRQLVGSWALVVLDGETGRMVASCHRSPLLVARSERGTFVASDILAIAEWVDEFTVMSDGDLVELGDVIEWENGGSVIPDPATVASTWAGDAAALTTHTDHMGREIDEQPEVAERILDELLPTAVGGGLWRSLGLPAFSRIAVLGCGTSLNAGRLVGHAFSQWGGVPHRHVIASEAACELLELDTAVLAFSQSGETADILRAIDTFDVPRGRLIAVTNKPYSALARRADSVVDCSAGPEVGVAATKTFVAQAVTGVCIALSALVAGGRLGPVRAAELAADLSGLPERLASAIAVSAESIPPLVQRWRDAPGFLFLGRGAGAIYAAEGALKLKELSYRWAEAYPAGELKHGPLALVEEGTPVIVIDNGDPRIESNIAEVRARGGDVVRIGGPASEVPVLQGIRGARWAGTGTPGAGWGPLEVVVPLQVFARLLALELGRDVDKPRNLAKSVTVE